MTFQNNSEKLLTLQEASQKLGVTPEVLLSWNEYQILKPTITASGQIGYTTSQIEQFLHIQQALRPQQNTQQNAHANSPTLAVHSVSSSFLEQPPLEQAPHQSHSTHQLRFFSLLVTILLLGSIGTLTQQEHLKSLLSQYENSYAHHTVPGNDQVSNLALNGPLAFTSSTQQKNDEFLGKNTHADTESAFAQKATNASTPTKTPPATPSGNHLNGVPIASVAGMMHAPAMSQNTNTAKIQEFSTFASVVTAPTGTSVTNSPFDKSGNIAGSPHTDTLAMNLGSIDALGSTHTPDQLTTNLRNQFLLMGIGGLGLIIYLLRRPHRKVAIQAIDTSERVLEIDQKMDGTVVLYMQGKEYKISKPELDSDSDQFIAKLMKLVSPNAKEIEYDSFADGKSTWSAPLSRLVTRLGFVGIKRDLFFPRTSKNRVLFRKYITRDDLRSMRLSIDQILTDLALVS